MSRKRRNQRYTRGQQALPEVKNQPVGRPEGTQDSSRKGGMTLDAYANPFSRLGPGEPNLMEASEYRMTRMTED